MSLIPVLTFPLREVCWAVMIVVFKLVRARPVGINPSADVTPQNSARESVLRPHSRRDEKTALVSIKTVRLSDADIDYLQTPDQSLTLE